MDIFNSALTTDGQMEYTILLPASASKEKYDVVLQDAYTLLKKLMGDDYLWHKEGFNLNHFSLNGITCLYGTTEVGDCIDDEWTIVYILKELSKIHKNIYIRVVDSDGEFLLIEASQVLPEWLTPDISDFRVWINDEEILLIPEKFNSGSLSFKQAADYIRTASGPLSHSNKIDKGAFGILSKYPQAAKEVNNHRAAVKLPRKVAAMLKQYPFYISLALEYFFSRDLTDSTMDAVPAKKLAEFPFNDVVKCTASLTRLQYAHLKGSPFTPGSKLNYDEDDKEAYLGVKITCAMELLARHSKKMTYLAPENVLSSADFQSYLRTLAQSGYFMGELPDSSRYKELVLQAKQLFLEARKYQNEAARFMERLHELKLPTDDEIESWDKTKDSDNWMDVEIDEKFDGQGDVGERMNDMLGKLQSFMDGQKAGIDGIDFNDGEDSSSSDSNDEDDEVVFGEGDPKIDEDDFLEFFLKEGLKLPPEEIEKYRADPDEQSKSFQKGKMPMTDESDSESSEDEWDRVEEELKSSGVLGANEAPDYNILQNILQSIKAEGGVTGPAATLLGQLGIPIPRDEEDLVRTGSNNPGQIKSVVESPLNKYSENMEDSDDDDDYEVYERGVDDGRLQDLTTQMNRAL